MACDTSAGAAGGVAAGGVAAVEHRPDVWTGRWPGEEDCERLGFLARFEPGSGWVPCAADDPDAVPHFDRLRAEATWDPHRGHWIA